MFLFYCLCVFQISSDLKLTGQVPPGHLVDPACLRNSFDIAVVSSTNINSVLFGNIKLDTSLPDTTRKWFTGLDNSNIKILKMQAFNRMPPPPNVLGSLNGHLFPMVGHQAASTVATIFPAKADRIYFNSRDKLTFKQISPTSKSRRECILRRESLIYRSHPPMRDHTTDPMMPQGPFYVDSTPLTRNMGFFHCAPYAQMVEPGRMGIVQRAPSPQNVDPSDPGLAIVEAVSLATGITVSQAPVSNQGNSSNQGISARVNLAPSHPAYSAHKRAHSSSPQMIVIQPVPDSDDESEIEVLKVSKGTRGLKGIKRIKKEKE